MPGESYRPPPLTCMRSTGLTPTFANTVPHPGNTPGPVFPTLTLRGATSPLSWHDLGMNIAIGVHLGNGQRAYEDCPACNLEILRFVERTRHIEFGYDFRTCRC